MTKTISLAIIDDHPMFREGVIRTLSEIGSFEVVGQGSTTSDAVNVANEHRPDIILLDISMPGGGLNVIAPILNKHPDQKIIMLTVSEASRDVVKALNCGVSGYVLKGVGSRQLAEILRTVASGERYVSPTLTAKLLTDLSEVSSGPTQTNPMSNLKSREKEILTLVAEGLSNKHIALRLDLHEKTVKHHLTRIFAKLNVVNRTEAALAFRDSDKRR